MENDGPDGPPRSRLVRALAHRHLPIAAAALSSLLLVPALTGGFQLDDHFQRFRLLGHGGRSIQLFEFYDGDPDVVRYRFDVPLEESSLRWLYWKGGTFHAWTPPGIGTSVSFPPSRGIFDYDP